jgi:hypothetical protein
MKKSLVGLLHYVAWLAACGCQASTKAQDAKDGQAPLPVCTWPGNLDSADASSGECVAARVYLSCGGSAAVAEECLSNDPTQCSPWDAGAALGAPPTNCTNLCTPEEYAVACGGPGPGPWPHPPAACRLLPSGPGGGYFACCPCGS